jgi:hypothetical protein
VAARWEIAHLEYAFLTVSPYQVHSLDFAAPLDRLVSCQGAHQAGHEAGIEDALAHNSHMCGYKEDGRNCIRLVSAIVLDVWQKPALGIVSLLQQQP